MYSISVDTRALGVLIKCKAAEQISDTLCGGIEVAIPTAIPWDPLAKRFGNPAGNTSGSSSSSL